MIFLWIVLAVSSARCAAQPQQTQVTLWQFGRPRLLQAQVTLPMRPMGTAEDGSATTYLYQALNAITTTNQAGFTTLLTPSATPRTIVAAASGWLESPTGSYKISCALINQDYGQCVDANDTMTTTANSGIPTPVVIPLEIATSILTPATATVSRSSNPAPTERPITRSSGVPTRLVVGSVIGAGALLILLAALLGFRMRRQRRRTKELLPYAYDAEPHHVQSSVDPKLARLLVAQVEDIRVATTRTQLPPVYRKT
ncbi:hypothetical protein B0H16DRAFT_1613260 [Mycena metata]|uniref:Mid2 domain-containing protein n=1 Tax=Mycena metata TaxID=1033252 RepID=A0AAD7HAW2_9AGAR|nr:hypothetical protein B0H16DRAFT_1613260 [Mycena metata]